MYLDASSQPGYPVYLFKDDKYFKWLIKLLKFILILGNLTPVDMLSLTGYSTRLGDTILKEVILIKENKRRKLKVRNKKNL